MKKFTFLIVVLTLVFAVNTDAQIKNGAVFLGGDIGGSTQKTKNNGTTVNNRHGLNISPSVGKAIKENLILGVDAGLSLYKDDNANPGPYTVQRNNFYRAGIFIRKYKPIGKSSFFIFLQGAFGINYNNDEYENVPSFVDKRKRYTIGISAYPGISYTISKKFQLETGFNNLMGLAYFTEKREVSGGPSYTEKTSGISISSSLNNLSSLYLGFRVLINR